ncbi:MAG: hypothetical protein ACXW5W_01555, partial [Candidatus Binatia bacterium]
SWISRFILKACARTAKKPRLKLEDRIDRRRNIYRPIKFHWIAQIAYALAPASNNKKNAKGLSAQIGLQGPTLKRPVDAESRRRFHPAACVHMQNQPQSFPFI